MKNLKLICYTIVLAAIVSSCSKSDKNENHTSSNPPQLKATVSVDIVHPCGIAVSVNGKVAVTQYNGGYGLLGTTRVWNSYSDLLTKEPPIATWNNIAAESVAFDRDENVYVSETEQTAAIKIYKKGSANGITTYGYFKTIQNGFSNPRGLVFDSHNRLYLADDGNDRLLRFDDPLNSDDQKVVASVFGSLKGLAIQNDTLYVTAYNKNVFYKFALTPEGGLGAGSTVGMDKLVDVAVYNNILALDSPDNSTITLLNTGTIKIEAAFSGKTTQLKSTGAIYGLAFVKTSKGFGLLSAQNTLNKIVLYE